MNRRRPFVKSALDISPELGFRSLPASGRRVAVERGGMAISAKIPVPRSISAKQKLFGVCLFAVFRATAAMAGLFFKRRAGLRYKQY
jgi:hypothetical protein